MRPAVQGCCAERHADERLVGGTDEFCRAPPSKQRTRYSEADDGHGQHRRTTPRAGRREWIGLAVIALACVLYVMDLTVLHLAVPEISEDLQPSSAQLLWIIDI